MNLETVQIIEVIWTLVAAVGLYFDVINMREAKRDYVGVVQAHVNGARLKWTRFSRSLNRYLATIHSFKMLIGVLAMLRLPSPDSTTWGQVFLLSAFVGSSVLVSLISVRWRQVHVAIDAELTRKGTVADRRQSEQDTREVGQNAREGEQNVRESDQNERDRR